MTTNNNREKVQQLLRDMFQFDCSDLDFGIYRIMNYKRKVIEKFINKDLLDAVAAELDKGALAEQSDAAEKVKELTEKAKETLGEDAIDAEGNLSEAYAKTKLGREYKKARDKATGAKARPALEAMVFNHLFSFFNRYYDNGDFMSKRRYSKKEKYAIPYNGEEVYLHWANSDQYYIKTSEHFQDYSFASKGQTIHFKLQNADVEQNNVKGDKRFFIPKPKEASFDKKKKEVIIPFKYRPLTSQEETKYGKKNQQDKILNEAVEQITGQFEKENAVIAGLSAEKRKTSDGKSVNFIEHHLKQYTRRNTSDFFIHKNLETFLKREFDFYIKNEVLNVDDLEAGGQDRTEGWFQVMKVIRNLGYKIIAFLAQIENFQKKLFEKKKFVTETQYCITVGNIDEKFYEKIAGNDNQWAEWKELFHIDENQKNLFNSNAKSKKDKRIAFLKTHPTLVLDTKHFDAGFVDELLASFDDIDEVTDGLLVHGENFQVIQLLQNKFDNKIKCIHIDPPYNTDTSGFLYKNAYKHSTWLSMMENRIASALSLMSPNASYLCHIDENEYERLHSLFEHIGIPDAGTIVWDKRNPMNAGRGIATQHEYVIWRSTKESPIYLRNESVLSMLKTAKDIIKKNGKVTKKAQQEYSAWVNNNDQLSGGEKAYRYLDEEGRIYQSVSLRAPEPRTDKKFHIPLKHPVTGKPCPTPPNGFSRTPETLKAMMEKGEIIFGPDETTQPRQKVVLTSQKQRQLSSVIQDGRKGKADLDRLGFDFPYCHPVSFYRELIASAVEDNSDIVFDYFAGSGTSAHAAINLNHEDGSNIRFILVEMGEYFDTVILPRIKKVTFSPEWKDGKPKRMATKEEAERSPRIVKYQRIESYEDALNNISFESPDGQTQLLKFDDYLLNYMLQFETKGSETFLNVEKLASPFSYKLVLQQGQETKEKQVDLPETFNYLLGLHVKTRQVLNDNGKKYLVYRGTVDHKDVVVIWRETKDWGKKGLEQDKKFVADNKLTAGADEVFVNGDSFIPKAKALDPVFKRRMFSTVEA